MASKSDWTNVVVETLSTEAQVLFADSKAAYRAYATAKAAFEAQMQADFAEHLSEGSELKFGYMFGKLSIAVGPKKDKAKAKEQAASLADWLAAQGEAGRGA